jgi:hypothetical protein
MPFPGPFSSDPLPIVLGHENPGMDQEFRRPPLIIAAREGDAAVLAELLAAGADVNSAWHHNGETALIYAASTGHLHVVRTLLNQPGVNVNWANHHGYTALMHAVANNYTDIVACLLEAGALVNVADFSGEDTALIQAARYGLLDIAQMLLRQPRIEVDKADHCGETALFHAARRINPAFVASLLDAGADMTRVSHAGDTALKAAIGSTRAAVIEKFLLHGAQLEDIDCYPHVPGAFGIAIADLRAERAMPDRDALEITDPHDFFAHLASYLLPDGSTRALLQWLPGQGMRMAAAQRVAAVLVSPYAVWQLAPGQSASVQQKMSCALSALSALDATSAKRSVREAYQEAGISDAAVERLSATACTQLDKLCALATQVMAEVSSAMLKKLIPRCLAGVTLDYKVDAHALIASLVSNGYCVPVAQAIARSWQAALAAVQEKSTSTVLPAGLTLKQVLEFVSEQTALHARVLFAQALQRELANQLPLAQRNYTPARSSDGAWNAMLEIQSNQLRQFCSQLL